MTLTHDEIAARIGRIDAQLFTQHHEWREGDPLQVGKYETDWDYLNITTEDARLLLAEMYYAQAALMRIRVLHFDGHADGDAIAKVIQAYDDRVNRDAYNLGNRTQ